MFLQLSRQSVRLLNERPQVRPLLGTRFHFFTKFQRSKRKVEQNSLVGEIQLKEQITLFQRSFSVAREKRCKIYRGFCYTFLEVSAQQEKVYSSRQLRWQSAAFTRLKPRDRCPFLILRKPRFPETLLTLEQKLLGCSQRLQYKKHFHVYKIQQPERVIPLLGKVVQKLQGNFLTLFYNFVKKVYSCFVAQRKRVRPITGRSEDRNLPKQLGYSSWSTRRLQLSWQSVRLQRYTNIEQPLVRFRQA